MAREIIVLDAAQESTQVNLVITFACWLTAPASRIVPQPNFKSAVPLATNGPSWGVTATELTALQAGTIVEQVSSVSLPVSGLTVAACEAAVQARFTALQTALTSQVFSTTHFVGASWDGTTWTAGP